MTPEDRKTAEDRARMWLNHAEDFFNQAQENRDNLDYTGPSEETVAAASMIARGWAELANAPLTDEERYPKRMLDQKYGIPPWTTREEKRAFFERQYKSGQATEQALEPPTPTGQMKTDGPPVSFLDEYH